MSRSLPVRGQPKNQQTGRSGSSKAQDDAERAEEPKCSDYSMYEETPGSRLEGLRQREALAGQTGNWASWAGDEQELRPGSGREWERSERSGAEEQRTEWTQQWRAQFAVLE